MSKQWKCGDCCCFDTDACHYPSMFEEYVACEHLVVDHNKAYQQGRADREAEIVTIIEQMKESASAMMWTEREVACEKILEQIKEQKNNYERFKSIKFI